MSVLYPNVPTTIAGIPAVLRDTLALSDATEALAVADDLRDADDLAATAWGVYAQDGTLAVACDAIPSFEYGGEFRIADYPLEQGGFESYNKVATPFNVRLVLSKGGTVSDRTAFLAAVETLHASLDLFDVVTPEHVYVGVNVERIGMVRNAATGAGMTTVEIGLREVRRTADVAFSKTPDAPTPAPAATAKTVKAPAAAKTANQGSVQTKPAPVATVKKALPFVATGRPGEYVLVYDKPLNR
jgi:hypothetical protein